MRSVVITAKAFLPTANENRAVLLGTTAGPIIFPPASTNGISGYLTSKMAQVNVLTFLASENPHLFVASVHPGMIETAMFRTSKADPNKLPMDTRKYSNMAGEARKTADAHGSGSTRGFHGLDVELRGGLSQWAIRIC